MFPKIQPDTLTSLYILKTFGEPFFPGIRNARVEFWTSIPNNEDPQKLEKEGYLLIDLGGMFDHHTENEASGEKKECLSTIVSKYLKVDTHPSLKKVLAWAKRDDLEGKGTVSADMLDRAFGLPGLIMNLNRLPQYSPIQIVSMITPLIDAHVREEYKRNIELPRLWKSLLETGKASTFFLRNGQKVAVVQTDEISLAGFIRNKEDVKLVITKGSKGHINLITKNDSNIDLKPLIKSIRYRESTLKEVEINETDLSTQGRVAGAEEWYYDTAANTLQNGGAHPQGINPTKLSLDEIVNLVKETYGTTKKGNLWIKIDSENRDLVLAECPPLYDEVYVDHVTLSFAANLADIQPDLLDQSVEFYAISERSNHQIQAVEVTLPESLKGLTDHPHITVSAKRGVPPVKANELFENPSETKIFPEPIKLQGKIEFFEFTQNE